MVFALLSLYHVTMLNALKTVKKAAQTQNTMAQQEWA